MNNLKLTDGARALVIVAHPDDETIWLGGTIARFNKVKWTILSLCRASDADREPKFHRVMKYYGATGLIDDLEDEDRLSILACQKPIKQIIAKRIGAKKFAYLFTHGANGEYGHERHIATHLAVKDMLAKKQLAVKQTFVFNYKKQSKYKLIPKTDSAFILKLSQTELKQKKKIVAEFYGYAPDGIDVGYCTQDEAFKIINP